MGGELDSPFFCTSSLVPRTKHCGVWTAFGTCSVHVNLASSAPSSQCGVSPGDIHATATVREVHGAVRRIVGAACWRHVNANVGPQHALRISSSGCIAYRCSSLMRKK